MRDREGWVKEVILAGGETTALIQCPPGAQPAAGQYCLAWATENAESPLASVLFPARIDEDGFLAAGPIGRGWEPGARLRLRGPLGRGFGLPPGARRVALAALGDHAQRLLPLITLLLEREAAIAVFTDCLLPDLPLAVEAYPLASLPESLSWADFFAVDLPLQALPSIRSRLGLADSARLPYPGQALVTTSMPCGGLADCGACAVPARRGWKLACVDGPVFHMNEIDW